MPQSSGTDEVLLEQTGSTLLVTLNRPKAINALTTAMVQALNRLYAELPTRRDIACVVLRGAGDKGLCAGGDVKGVVQGMLRGRQQPGLDFFRAEYAMNARLAALPAPHVALLEGVVMGGGAGVSVHGRFRLATEKTVFAMPECAIGFVPDVGASFFLPRLPGRLGEYLATTGARLRGAEVRAAGLATHYVPSARLPALLEKLQGLRAEEARAGGVARALDAAQAAEPLPPCEAFREQLPQIDAAFGAETLAGIHAALEASSTPWGRATLKAVRGGSPLSQALSLRLVREGRGMPLGDCLRREFRVAARMVRGEGDLAEGVRCLLIDRGQAPRWRCPSIQEVTQEQVERFFAPLEGVPDLDLSGVGRGPGSHCAAARL